MNNLEGVRFLLAKNVKKIRKSQNMTQERLAELADISNTYIANIECGKTWVGDGTLDKIAAAFNIPAYELFIDAESEPQNIGLRTNTLSSILSTKEKKLTLEVSNLIKNTMSEIKNEFGK